MEDAMTEPRWSVEDMRAEDVQEVRALFGRVFGHPLSDALWSWKYAENRGFGVGARSPDGELLAHYGGTLRQLYVLGHAVTAVQIGDVMVAQEGRAALSFKGPFGLAAEAFLSRHVGILDGPAMGFGFPNARHMRLGERLGHYARVDKIHELTWALEGKGMSDGSKADLCTECVDWLSDSTDSEINQLWQRMQADLVGFVVPVRNAAWMRHRYAQHPDHPYACFWVRRVLKGDVLGFFVLRARGDVLNEQGAVETWELLDWVARLGDAELVVHAARGMLAEAGAKRLMGWFSESIRQRVVDTGATVQEACEAAVTVPGETGGFLVADGCSLLVSDIQGIWWLTGGDTDFR